MRVNVYAEEMTDKMEIISKEIDGHQFTGMRFWLLGYLSGKALTAFILKGQQKGLHHIISSAASLLNWHRNATGQMTGMAPGIKPDQSSLTDPNGTGVSNQIG